MITGISSTSPTSKNIGKPIRAPTSAIIHGSARTLDRPTRVSTIRSAPPESASNLPYIAPEADENADTAHGVAEPLAKAATESPAPRPAAIPTPMAPIISARNAWSLSQVISTTITAIPPTAARISWVFVPLGTIGSGAAKNTGTFNGTPFSR